MQVDEKTLLSLLADEKTQHKAFEILVRQYSEPLYRQIRRMVLYHDDADDVMQNTFIKAWKGLPTFEGRSKRGSTVSPSTRLSTSSTTRTPPPQSTETETARASRRI